MTVPLRSSAVEARGLSGRILWADGTPPPDGVFAALEVLSPARDFPNRHESILLAWDAVLGEIDDARQT